MPCGLRSGLRPHVQWSPAGNHGVCVAAPCPAGIEARAPSKQNFETRCRSRVNSCAPVEIQPHGHYRTSTFSEAGRELTTVGWNEKQALNKILAHEVLTAYDLGSSVGPVG